jgi:hypothetical protein
MARDYQKTKENKRKAAETAKRHASSITRFVGRNGPGGDYTAASTAPIGTAVTTREVRWSIAVICLRRKYKNGKMEASC